MNLKHIKVNTQSSIRIEGSKVLYFDPFQIGAETKKYLGTLDGEIQVELKL